MFQFGKLQCHYIEVAQGAIFIEQNEIWADFGPVGNTEKLFLENFHFSNLLAASGAGC